MTNPLQAGVDHAELRRLAEAATPGPWYRGHNENGASQGEMSVWPDSHMIGGLIAKAGWQMPWEGWFEQPAKDAAYIAAANPAVMVALLNEIDALQEAYDRATRLHAATCRELQALRAAPVLPDRGWRPIESAPRDGAGILAYNPMVGIYHTAFTTRWSGEPNETGYEGFPCGYWHTGDVRCYAYGKWDAQPTHWMPLPDAPAEGAE